jgi:hypothetical protein
MFFHPRSLQGDLRWCLTGEVTLLNEGCHDYTNGFSQILRCHEKEA